MSGFANDLDRSGEVSEYPFDCNQINDGINCITGPQCVVVGLGSHFTRKLERLFLGHRVAGTREKNTINDLTFLFKIVKYIGSFAPYSNHRFCPTIKIYCCE